MEENLRIITSSNSFKVNDRAKLYEFLGNLKGEELVANAHVDKDGNTYGSFGAYSDVLYKIDDNATDEEYNKAYSEMIKTIQELISEDSYCCIKTIGNERLSILGDLVYITKENVDVYSFSSIEQGLTRQYFSKEAEEE